MFREYWRIKMVYKSILNQLKKYSQTNEQTHKIITKSNNNEHLDFDLDLISKQIAATDKYIHIEAVVELSKTIKKKLQDMPLFEASGKLYPYITLARYHLSYVKQYPTSEKVCDDEIKEFMSRQSIEEYAKEFKKYCDETSKKVVLTRALQATFPYGNVKLDFMPETLRNDICDQLNISRGTTYSNSAVMLQELNQKININQQILGRLGYLIMWTWYNNKKELLLLTSSL